MNVTKRRARKSVAAGDMGSIGYANYPIPGMRSNKHVTFNVGDFIFRFTFEEVEELARRAELIKNELAEVR